MRFVVVILLFAFNLLLVNGRNNSQSELHHIVNRVFSRQKRFVLFPKGSNLKFTGSISKGLLSQYPKGIGLSIEQALYYPVPTTRLDVYPKRLRPTTTAKPKVSTTPTYVWIPGTHWRFKAQHVKSNRPRPRPMKPKLRIDNRPLLAHVNSTKWTNWSKYAQQYQKWTPATQYYNKYAKPWQSAAHNQWSKWTTPSPKWTSYGVKRWHRSAEETAICDAETAFYDDVHYADLEPHVNWHHYQGHRDRRQLFEHFDRFSELFGFNVKTCILRAMCDSKRLLLPPGYSMFHDVVRLIFTMPTIDGVDDDFSQTMRLKADDCARQFRDQCRVNLLALIFGGHSN